MSQNFDPSKLDLDLSSEENTQAEAQSQETQDPLAQDIHASKELAPVTPSEPEEAIQKADQVETQESSKTSQEKISENPSDTLEAEISKNDEHDEATQKSNSNDETHREINAVPEEAAPDLPTRAKQEKSEEKIIDINIENLESIITLIEENEYQYAIIEPLEDVVKIIFKQDNVEREIKYIRYPTYTSILFKVKQSCAMVVEDTQSTQEGKGKIQISGNEYLIGAKTLTSSYGEKIWIKSKKQAPKDTIKKKQKASLGQIFGFLGAILFISLVFGGMFISFIVLNTNDINDVRFFSNLGINLNEINTFIGQLVAVIFGVLLMILSSLLAICLFKALLMKKSYHQRKILYFFLSGILMVLTLTTASAWMYVDAKVKSLPNWEDEVGGDIKIYDNALYISDEFEAHNAQLYDTQNLIGPVDIYFDLSKFHRNQQKSGLVIRKYIWKFGNEEVETFDPSLIQSFTEKGNYEVLVTAQGVDPSGEEVEVEIANIPPVSISHVISIIEKTTTNGGKKLEFDGTDLKNLGKLQWYLKSPSSQTNPKYKDWEEKTLGYEFFPSDIFFEEMLVGVSIENASRSEEQLDKIFVISPNSASEISGKIAAKQSFINEKEFSFTVENASTSFGNGFIESFQWQIEGKSYDALPSSDIEGSSLPINHEFKDFGQKQVTVILRDTAGKEQKITETILIAKQVQLRDTLQFSNANKGKIEDIRYEKESHEYYIDEIGIPATITIDAKYVRPKNIIYTLKEVTWDVGNDGQIDATSRNFDYELQTAGSHSLAVNYVFVHRKNPDDIIKLTEYIFTDAVKKDAMLSLSIDHPSDYVPVTVAFDASQSYIKNDDIVKFEYDYGDGVVESRDAVNPGHKYTKAGDYTVKLTVTGRSGKTYSLEKKLILLPPAQRVVIESSMKRAPTQQGIDFSSSKSEGQIVEYFWEFGDGNISTEANPTHSYRSPGKYKIKLTASFANKNTNSDEIEIMIE